MGKKDLKNQWIKEYENEYRRQTEVYEQWIAKWEPADSSVKEAEGTSVNEDTAAEEVCVPALGSMGCGFFIMSCDEIFTSWNEIGQNIAPMLAQSEGRAEYAIITGEKGELSKHAKEWIADYFTEHPKTDILYGDEDEWEPAGQKRQNPWFKPDWSPDTLRSYLYVGNIIVIKIGLLKEAAEKLADESVCQQCRQQYSEYSVFWGFLLYLTDSMNARWGHIDRILYHKEICDGDISCKETFQEKIFDKEISGNEKFEKKTSAVVHVRPSFGGEPSLVSVIIPSKDHPKMLQRCLNAIKEATEYPSYEMIVVDNGSTEENRALIEAMQGHEGMEFEYLYEEMEFNFSKMCNMGASKAKGEILIFLNDDIEVCGKDWMTILTEQAGQPHIGAVGAKLYYPDSKMIQHVGITNMKVGPVHKLAGMEDRGNIYHGRNLADYNVLAVTAACMAVRRTVFEDVGGFCEELAVAYNDVDLCFSLYEKGYYNLVRNDVILYHHESVSRGSDEGGEKAKRLLRERKKLYQRHPELYGKDPFYSVHLVQERLDGDYHVEYQYAYECGSRYSQCEKTETVKETKKSILRKLLHKGPLMLYHMDDIRIRQTDLPDEDSKVLELEGWCALTDKDMTEYHRALLLVGEDNTAWKLEMLDKLRPDTSEILAGQPHGALCGFVVRVKEGVIPSGEYKVGYLFTPKDGRKDILEYGEDIQI